MSGACFQVTRGLRQGDRAAMHFHKELTRGTGRTEHHLHVFEAFMLNTINCIVQGIHFSLDLSFGGQEATF